MIWPPAPPANPPTIHHPDPRPGTHLIEDAFGYVIVIPAKDGSQWICTYPRHGARHCDHVRRRHP